MIKKKLVNIIELSVGDKFTYVNDDGYIPIREIVFNEDNVVVYRTTYDNGTTYCLVAKPMELVYVDEEPSAQEVFDTLKVGQYFTVTGDDMGTELNCSEAIKVGDTIEYGTRCATPVLPVFVFGRDYRLLRAHDMHLINPLDKYDVH